MATAVISSNVISPAGVNSVGEALRPMEPVLPQPVQLPIVPIDVDPDAAPYSALPNTVLFGALRHPTLKLRKPILLQTERTDAGINVVWIETQEFGAGETFSSAIEDFGLTVAELYIRLGECDSPLSTYLQEIRKKLAEYIEVRQPQ